jgi:hypothetical protein
MTSVPHSGAKSVNPGGSVAGGHTKEPWVVTSDGHYVSPAADLTKIVALVFRPDTDSETERHDNARLIAAAPDAFGLAVDFIQWVDEFTGTLPEPQSDALFDLYRRARRIYLTVDQKGHDASRADLIAKATAGETRNAEPIHRRDGDEG